MKGTPLSADYLKRNSRHPWADITVFGCINSTSDWIKEQSSAYLVCLAEQQTAGRGRHGHEWHSPNAENIYLSFSWQFDKVPDHLGLLGLWMGIVLSETMEKFGLKDHGVKWPNDLYWQQKKMGGILVEASNLSSKLVIGIGLNVNMEVGECIDQPWTSVSEALSRFLDRNELLVTILDALYVAMIEFPHMSTAEFMRRWNKCDLIRGHSVSFNNGDSQYVGEARGVDEQGHLKVMLESGELRSFGTTISQVRWQ